MLTKGKGSLVRTCLKEAGVQVSECNKTAKHEPEFIPGIFGGRKTTSKTECYWKEPGYPIVC